MWRSLGSDSVVLQLFLCCSSKAAIKPSEVTLLIYFTYLLIHTMYECKRLKFLTLTFSHYSVVGFFSSTVGKSGEQYFLITQGLRGG